MVRARRRDASRTARDGERMPETQTAGLTAIMEGRGLPIAAGIATASPHEVTLVDETIDNGFLDHVPDRLIGDRAYGSDGLDERLWGNGGSR